MYMTVRHYARTSGPQEAAERLQTGLVPLLARVPGFIAYYSAALEPGGALSATLFERRDEALEANELTRDWVVTHLRHLAPHPPEVTGGEVLCAVAGEPGVEAHLTVHVFDAGMLPHVGVPPDMPQTIAASCTGLAGFRRFYALRSEGHSNRRLVVTLHEDEAAAAAARRAVASLLETRPDLAPNPPVVIAGRVVATRRG